VNRGTVCGEQSVSRNTVCGEQTVNRSTVSVGLLVFVKVVSP
jgi:hypothetical protein